MNSFRSSTRRINTRRYQSRAVRRERSFAGGYHARAERRERVHAGGYHARMGFRELLTAIVLCAAIFACSFAVGRDASTASAPYEVGPLALPVSSTGTAIATRLSKAPPVEIEVPPATRPAKAHGNSGGGAATTAPAVSPAPISEGRATVAPVTSTPAPAPSHVSPASPQPRTQAPPAAPSAPKVTVTHSPEAGQSFETSG